MNCSSLADRARRLQIQALQLVRETLSRMCPAFAKVSGDNDGQPPTEYLMIWRLD